MVKKATPKIVKEIAELILDGKIRDLTITLRTAGKGKGKIYAEYFLHTPIEETVSLDDRIHISNILKEIANDLEAGQKYSTLVLVKDTNSNQYVYTIHKEE